MGSADRLGGLVVEVGAGHLLQDPARRRRHRDVGRRVEGGAGLEGVADLDAAAAAGIEFHVALHAQHVLGVADVLDRDAAAVDLERVAEGVLVQGLHRTQAHRAGTYRRRGAGIVSLGDPRLVADDDLAEVAAQGAQVRVANEQPIRILVLWLAHLDTQGQRGRSHRQDPRADETACPHGKIDLIAFEEDFSGRARIRARQRDVVLEDDALGALDEEIAAIQDRQATLERDVTRCVDHKVTTHGDVVPEGDV